MRRGMNSLALQVQEALHRDPHGGDLYVFRSVDILGKWHGTRYRFIQRYRSGFAESLGEEFDAPFARLDWISRDRFNLQWHRHTGEWFCLYRGLTRAEAIDTLKSDGLFHPH
jgi:hypothetical protein